MTHTITVKMRRINATRTGAEQVTNTLISKFKKTMPSGYRVADNSYWRHTATYSADRRNIIFELSREITEI
jgi:hypothetical protein